MHLALERFLIAARLETPDQVQAAPFATGHFISWFAGIPEARAIEYWERDYRRKLSAQLTVIKAFPDVMFWPGVWADFGLAPETSALGCEIAFPENAPPAVRTPAVKKLEDIDRLEVPDPYRDGLMPIAIEAYEYMVKNIPRELRENFGYGHWSIAMGPTDVAGLSMGYDKFLVGLYKYPEAVHKLMKIVTETIIIWIKTQQEVIGSDMLTFIGGDADCFLNPKQFETFSYPYLKQVCDTFKRKDNVVLYHNDGDTTHLLDKLRDIGADMFNYGQDMDTALAKRKVGDKMCLVGGLNSIGVLLRGSSDDVDRTCKKVISEGAQGGGFVLSQEGAMAAHTPTENIWAMIKAAEKYGKYPLKHEIMEDLS